MLGSVIFHQERGADMKFICLGFYDETNWAQVSESDRKSFMEGCFAYDDELRRGGHFLGGEALQAARNAATVRCLDARDLDHAIQLMSKHPGVRAGFSGFEIRPANEEINALVAARKT
jgi:hypothetical protein